MTDWGHFYGIPSLRTYSDLLTRNIVEKNNRCSYGFILTTIVQLSRYRKNEVEKKINILEINDHDKLSSFTSKIFIMNRNRTEFSE